MKSIQLKTNKEKVTNVKFQEEKENIEILPVEYRLTYELQVKDHREHREIDYSSMQLMEDNRTPTYKRHKSFRCILRDILV